MEQKTLRVRVAGCLSVEDGGFRIDRVIPNDINDALTEDVFGDLGRSMRRLVSCLFFQAHAEDYQEKFQESGMVLLFDEHGSPLDDSTGFGEIVSGMLVIVFLNERSWPPHVAEAMLKNSAVLSKKPGKTNGNRRGQVFLCHASEDKDIVREMYRKLEAEGYSLWLDKINLIGGVEWQKEIPKALRSSACVLIFLSEASVAKRGYVQREFKLAIDTFEEIPDEQVFAVPILIDECSVPESLRRFHWIRLDEPDSFNRICASIDMALGE